MFFQELQQRQPIKELAANPLLLTLLCLEFDNNGKFPRSRSELYGWALNVLLSKWDGQRRIKRDEVYKSLSLKRKETLLGQLAMYTFDQGDYFFEERVAMQQIEQYIRNLPGAKEDSAALEVDSLAVLKSMESQHGLLTERATGIYSFSHLTLQEYFTAKNILDWSNPSAQEVTLGNLIEHMGEKRWNEVFLLVVEGLDKADYLLQLMKQRIDLVILNDLKLQEFLEWVQKKSESVKLNYVPAAIRVFYLARANALTLDVDLAHARNLDFDLALDLALDRALDLALNCTLDQDLDLALEIALARANALAQDPKFKRRLQEVYDLLPRRDDLDGFKQWWEQNSDRWTDDLRQIMIEYRNIGHDWQLTDEQESKLQEYYDANRLLIDCLKSECYVSREVREEIEATMLLPMSEIERWKRELRKNAKM